MPACRRELEREGGGRERESRREEDFPPPASSRDGSNFRREETRGERRGKSAGEREEKFSSSFPLSAHMPACRRGGRKMGMGKRGASREREKRERERGERERRSGEREEDKERENVERGREGRGREKRTKREIKRLRENAIFSKFHLVDLAGSERAKRTGADGLRLKEGSEYYLVAYVPIFFSQTLKSALILAMFMQAFI